MINLTLENLEKCFEMAKETGAEYIGVAVRLKDTNKKEVIINHKENFELKIGYYKQAYNNDLTLKNVKGIAILGFTYGDSFAEIQDDLLKS